MVYEVRNPCLYSSILSLLLKTRRRNGESTFSGKKDLEESSVVALKDMTDHGKSAGSCKQAMLHHPFCYFMILSSRA